MLFVDVLFGKTSRVSFQILNHHHHHYNDCPRCRYERYPKGFSGWEFLQDPMDCTRSVYSLVVFVTAIHDAPV